MEKERELRYQHASDIRTDLQRLKRDTESGRVSATVTTSSTGWCPVAPAEMGGRRPGRGVFLALTLLALGFGWSWFKGKQSAPQRALSEEKITHSLAENSVLGGTISPNGKHVAYADHKGLHLIAIESGESHDIALPEELRTHLLDVDMVSRWGEIDHRVLIASPRAMFSGRFPFSEVRLISSEFTAPMRRFLRTDRRSLSSAATSAAVGTRSGWREPMGKMQEKSKTRKVTNTILSPGPLPASGSRTLRNRKRQEYVRISGVPSRRFPSLEGRQVLWSRILDYWFGPVWSGFPMGAWFFHRREERYLEGSRIFGLS